MLYDNNKLNLELGIYDVDGSGSLALLEAGHRFSFGDDSHTRTALGLWQLRTSLPSYDGSPHAFTTGFYSVQELNLRLQQATTDHHERRLMAFIQYGYANPQLSVFREHVGGGIVWPLPFGRTNDSIGAGATLVLFGHSPGTSVDYDTEAAFEFYYKLRVNRYVTISPDTQFIRFPGGIQGQADALVFTPRVTLTF